MLTISGGKSLQNSCSDLFLLPTLEDEGIIDTKIDEILPLDYEDWYVSPLI
jgi:hypothetical protein